MTAWRGRTKSVVLALVCSVTVHMTAIIVINHFSTFKPWLAQKVEQNLIINVQQTPRVDNRRVQEKHQYSEASQQALLSSEKLSLPRLPVKVVERKKDNNQEDSLPEDSYHIGEGHSIASNPQKIIGGEAKLRLDKIGLTKGEINKSIASYLNEYQDELMLKQVETCLIYQIEHGTKYCIDSSINDFSYLPNMEEEKLVAELFAGVTKQQDDQRLAARLGRENEQLLSIVSEESAASQYAKTLRQLNQQTILYLNQEFMFDSSPDLAGSCPPLTCVTTKIRICNPMPCIFKYTEFKIARPKKMDDENTFTVNTTIFSKRTR